MPLQTGSQLGPYEILSAAGSGGMGEVFRARDTRLGRDVAIKVLPSHLASSPDLRARLEREAKSISSLQHPNICTLFDIGHQDGVDFLVMEFLEGETLADRLKKGPLPADHLLKNATEIADALSKAHRQGIIHRDLKPGNVMLTKSGAKLMDFGLAKPAATGMAAGATLPAFTAAVTQSSPHSPITAAGSIVGTYQYMSPEQIQGHEADARSDIFSFGAMLYEMATGRRAFEGKSQLSVASAILEKDPEPISAVQPLTPPALDHLVRTCLAKDPADRWQTAHDLALELRYLSTSSGVALAHPQRRRGLLRNPVLAWSVAALLAVAAVVVAFTLGRRQELRVVRSLISAPPGTSFEITGDFAGPPVLSPDGNSILFTARGSESPVAIWVRPLNSLNPRRLDGTDDASFPFWSPDGQWIAFFADGRLKKIAASGGGATSLADAPQPRGGAWGKDVIVFSPHFRGPLLQVSPHGGAVTPATTLDDTQHTTHRWPSFLPDGRRFLYLAANHASVSSENVGLYLTSLEAPQSTLVVRTDAGAQYASGYLLYRRQTALVAQSFNLRSGTLEGDALPIVDGVLHDVGTWHAIFSASSNGTLVYQFGGMATGTILSWVDRAGKASPPLGERTGYRDPRISPDGRYLAIAMGDPQWDIWIIDLERGVRTRLTFGNNTNTEPSWSADGRSVVFAAATGTRVNFALRMKAANGAGQEQVLIEESAAFLTLPTFTSDGKNVLALRRTGPYGTAIVAIPLQGDRKPVTVLEPSSPQANILDFRISRDGRWLAYSSTESGRSEVYVSRFPPDAGKWQISVNGGDNVRWRADGKELFFRGDRGWMYSVGFLASGNDVRISTPQRLFYMDGTAIGTGYDLAPDGRRLLMNLTPQQAPEPVALVQNWPAELKK